MMTDIKAVNVRLDHLWPASGPKSDYHQVELRLPQIVIMVQQNDPLLTQHSMNMNDMVLPRFLHRRAVCCVHCSRILILYDLVENIVAEQPCNLW